MTSRVAEFGTRIVIVMNLPMRRTSNFRSHSRLHQRGQALVYGIFFMIASLTSMFFLFNTGQLTSEKTKLVNTADAVAYSAAVMHARALNFDAYNNRALVANEVLVAQMVSLSSWGQYISGFASNINGVFPECATLYGAMADVVFKFDALYAAACFAATYHSEIVPEIADKFPGAMQAVVSAVEANKNAIRAAESVLHAPQAFNAARTSVMNDVAARNYSNDGTVSVEPGIAPTLAAASMTDDWQNFTAKYAGDDRTRFAEVARIAAYSDNFVRQRGWDSRALSPVINYPCGVSPHFNSVKRRGGTELIGLDEWKAEDTQSSWTWRSVSVDFFGAVRECREFEIPVTTGVQQAYPAGNQQDESGAALGGSPSTNPQASNNGSSNAWTTYSGLPSFYDLSSARLNATNQDPRLQFTVRVIRNQQSARTSGAASQILPSARLNNFNNNFAGGVMSAMATGEAYFERPLTNSASPDQGAWNQYAEKNGSTNRRELASLFNPFWQARLVPTAASNVSGQQAGQGALLPPLLPSSPIAGGS